MDRKTELRQIRRELNGNAYDLCKINEYRDQIEEGIGNLKLNALRIKDVPPIADLADTH